MGRGIPSHRLIAGTFMMLVPVPATPPPVSPSTKKSTEPSRPSSNATPPLRHRRRISETHLLSIWRG